MEYSSLTKPMLRAELERLQSQYDIFKGLGLKLDMSRGKPNMDQLDITEGMLGIIDKGADCLAENGLDCRNYGLLDGIPEAKKLFSDVYGIPASNILVGGNSSLNLMYDTIARAMLYGVVGGDKPWCMVEKRKFLCPAPGYDRHFAITESLGFELITVPMTPTGPDMDMIEEYVKDPAVKMVWVVPKYSNPDGIIFSDETIRRFAHLKPAAPDFTIVWDNAYSIHEFEGDYVPFPDILSLCREAGNPDMVCQFASTSKITFAGGGISCMAASEANIQYFIKLYGIQMICNDKVNQLRHVKFLKNKEHTLEIMKRHAAILAPKFRVVSDYLNREIGPLGFANWVDPKGGYFVSLNTMPGTAKRTWQLCKEAGVVLTNAGASFPYGIDPNDSNLRIAPSLPPVEELEKAMEVLCISLKLAALEKLLQK